MATTSESPGLLAYIGMKHFCPAVVRDLRAAMDVGVSGEEMRKLVRKHVNQQRANELGFKVDVAEQAERAIAYLEANPRAGVVRWIDGSQYTFIE